MTDILTICRSQDGYREQAGGRTKYGSWLDEQAGTHEYYNADWCGSFLLWCIAQVPGGLDAAGGLHKEYAYVQNWFDWMHAHGRISRTPAARRLVWYDWAGTPEGANHIGLVDHYDSSHVWAWEGNHEQQVELVKRPRDGQIMGYGEWWSHIAAAADDDCWFMAGA